MAPFVPRLPFDMHVKSDRVPSPGKMNDVRRGIAKTYENYLAQPDLGARRVAISTLLKPRFISDQTVTTSSEDNLATTRSS